MRGPLGVASALRTFAFRAALARPSSRFAGDAEEEPDVAALDRTSPLTMTGAKVAKNGAVVSHLKIAARPEDISAVRIAAGGADLGDRLPGLAAELPNLLAGDAQRYHDYAFATVRMVGSGSGKYSVS